MPQPIAFDGPRPIRDDEWRDSERLFRICFSGQPPEFELPAEEKEGKIEGPNAEVQVICADGRVVSQIAIFWERLKVHEGVVRIGSIGGVSTHPHYREHRFALRLLQRCAERLRERGAEVMLISGGRGLYTRSGNVPAGKMHNFSLRPGMLTAPPGYTLRPASPADAQACRRLYMENPVRFGRTKGAFEERFNRPAGFVKDEDLVIEKDGRIEAYLLLFRIWEDDDNPDTGRRAVWEMAGNQEALLAGAAMALDGEKINELLFPAMWQEQELIDALSQTGAKMETWPLFGHTMRLLNFPAMRKSLRPYIVARLGEDLYRELRFEQTGPLLRDSATLVEEGRCAIVLGCERFELDTMQMTLLVMGDPENALAGVEIPGWLSHVVKALFPLPSFVPGLNYH